MDTLILKFPENAQLMMMNCFHSALPIEDLRIERNNKGELIIMSPFGSLTGNIHFRIYAALAKWFETHPNEGYIFDSSAGFRLPDGSVLSLDAAYISKSRWDTLSRQEQEKFAPLTPDFVIKVLSTSDSENQLQIKMKTWMQNGCLLAWLINPISRKAMVYTPDGAVRYIDSFTEKLLGNGVLPGFQLDLSILS